MLLFNHPSVDLPPSPSVTARNVKIISFWKSIIDRKKLDFFDYRFVLKSTIGNLQRQQWCVMVGNICGAWCSRVTQLSCTWSLINDGPRWATASISTKRGTSPVSSDIWHQNLKQMIRWVRMENSVFWLIFGLSPNLGLSKGWQKTNPRSEIIQCGNKSFVIINLTTLSISIYGTIKLI